MIDATVVANIRNELDKINNTDDLRRITELVKNRRDWISVEVKSQLRIGDNVTVNNGRTKDKGVITKVNRTRAVVDMRNGSWTVPFSMITKEQTDGNS